MNKRWIAGGVLTALLAAALLGCDSAPVTPAEGDTADDGEATVITLIRTKSPIVPLTDEEIRNLGRGQGGDRNEEQIPDIQEKGNGMELDGYSQLLDNIDRDSFEAPGGWDRHPIDDLFDGLFETTDQGTNKYGTNDSVLTIEWSMDDTYILDAYTVVTASDGESFPERTPQNWTLEGSEDGRNWQVLDEVISAGLPVANYQPITFTIENETAYRHYRWVINETPGNNMFQVSELLLYTRNGPRGITFVDYGISAEDAKAGSPLTGKDALDYIDSHESLQPLVNWEKIYTDAETYGDGPVQNLFDEIYTEVNFNNFGQQGKMGTGDERARVVWQTDEAVTLSAYALITGNDNLEYQDRLPLAWSLYGSDDGKEWSLIDAVSDGKMESLNFEPYVYTVEQAQAYSYYTIVFEESNGGIQLCELLMLG